MEGVVKISLCSFRAMSLSAFKLPRPALPDAEHKPRQLFNRKRKEGGHSPILTFLKERSSPKIMPTVAMPQSPAQKKASRKLDTDLAYYHIIEMAKKRKCSHNI